MKKIIIPFLLVSSLIFAQNKGDIPKKKVQKGFGVIDFLSVDMKLPDPRIPNENHLGLSGIHYNFDLNNFYTGVGIYGALRGDRGGFFTLGVNAGYKAYLTEKLFVDTGFHFGGGGGAAAPDGGGAFILPKFNLGYQFKYFSITSGYSYINFFDGGNIKSHQLNLAVQVPLNFEYTEFSNAQKSFKSDELKESDWNKPSSRFGFMVHLNNLNVRGNSLGDLDIPLSGSTIRLAGFEVSSYLNDNWFAFFKVDGAYDGIKAGYMDVFFGGGYHFSMNRNRTNILTKFGIGAGGGGGVQTQGGVLLYPDISLEQHLYNNIYLSVNTGMVVSPNSFFESRSYGLGLKYYTNMNGIQPKDKFERGTFKGFEAIVKQDFYKEANRIDDPAEDLYQIAVQLNYYLNKNIFLAGQTAFANFGNAGAYAEGIVGAGYKSNEFFDKKISLFAQFLVGGAGGGNISTGEGLIIKPSAGLYYKLSPTLSLRTAVGYVRSKGGTLDSFTANIGVSYKLAFLNSK